MVPHHVPEITVQRIEDYQFIESADGEAEPRIFPELSKLLFEGNSGTPLQHMPLITLTSTGGHYFSKRIAFGSGKGARVVTRYQVEADILREGVLAYFYQGITADKMHFVFATFPIKMRGLAVDSHLGYSTKTREEYRRVLHSQDDYNRKAEIWMGENRDTIQPNLELLDRIMESVSVTEPELDLKE